MWFSLAIFSADCPIDSPGEGSAMAGETGIRSRGRMREKTPSRWLNVFALLASIRMSARRRDARIGMSESDSTPPARMTLAWPRAIWSWAEVIAWPAEAQARFKEKAGVSLGNWGRRLTSRATFGTSADGTTCPKITSSTSGPSKFVRSSSSRAAYRARSTARASFNTVPDLQNGVRHPATTATRRPFPRDIRFSLQDLPPGLLSASWRGGTRGVRSGPKPTTRPIRRGVGRVPVLVPHARRRARRHGRRSGGRAGHRRRNHWGGHRPRRRPAGLAHCAHREERRGRRHQLALLAADSRRPALSGTLRLPACCRCEPGAPRVAAHRTASGTSPPFPPSVLSRRPRAGLEGARGHVALRPPRGLPKREAAPVARAAGGPEGRAGAARSRGAGGGALLRRADRRPPPRPRHHARRRTVLRA